MQKEPAQRSTGGHGFQKRLKVSCSHKTICGLPCNTWIGLGHRSKSLGLIGYWMWDLLCSLCTNRAYRKRRFWAPHQCWSPQQDLWICVNHRQPCVSDLDHNNTSIFWLFFSFNICKPKPVVEPTERKITMERFAHLQCFGLLVLAHKYWPIYGSMNGALCTFKI